MPQVVARSCVTGPDEDPSSASYLQSANAGRLQATGRSWTCHQLPLVTRQMLLASDAGRRVLDSWPQYQRSVVLDNLGRPHVHLDVFRRAPVGNLGTDQGAT